MVPNMSQHSYCTCFTVHREYLWVGTNRGTISILSTDFRDLVKEIPFSESGRTVEVKYLAVSSEDEVSSYCIAGVFREKIFELKKLELIKNLN